MARNSLGPDRQAAAFIRTQRRHRAQSPEQLAQDIGVSGNTIRRCELGFLPYDHTQGVIARFFGLKPEEIWRKTRVDYLRAAADKAAAAEEAPIA